MFPFSVDNCCCTYIIRTALRGNFSAWDKREEKERKREGYSSISGYPSLFIVLNIFYIVNWWEYIPLFILTECAARTVSYGPSFFPRLMAQARSARDIKRGKKTGIRNLRYGPSK